GSARGWGVVAGPGPAAIGWGSSKTPGSGAKAEWSGVRPVVGLSGAGGAAGGVSEKAAGSTNAATATPRRDSLRVLMNTLLVKRSERVLLPQVSHHRCARRSRAARPRCARSPEDPSPEVRVFYSSALTSSREMLAKRARETINCEARHSRRDS